MSVLGGDDAGGGVIWAPQVIEEASDHGLVLGDNGVLYNSAKHETLPDGIAPMPPLDETTMQVFAKAKVSAAQFVPRFVARYYDMMAMADHNEPVRHTYTILRTAYHIEFREIFDILFLQCNMISDMVTILYGFIYKVCIIGKDGMLIDEPGFTLELLRGGGGGGGTGDRSIDSTYTHTYAYVTDSYEVLMIMRGLVLCERVIQRNSYGRNIDRFLSCDFDVFQALACGVGRQRGDSRTR